MTNHLIILENIEDWAPYFPSAQVIAVDDYLQTPSPVRVSVRKLLISVTVLNI